MAKVVPLLAGLGLALIGYACIRRARRARPEDATAVGRDERLIGAERFARKGDEEVGGEETTYVGL